MINEIFEEFGSDHNTIKIVEACNNTINFVNCSLAEKIGDAVFPKYAEKCGYNEIVKFFENFSQRSVSDQDMELKLEKTLSIDRKKLQYVGIEAKDEKIMSLNFYLPVTSDSDKIALQFGSTIQDLVTPYIWFTKCLPQKIDRYLFDISFGQGKPSHEVDYDIGLNMENYQMIGLA